MADRPLLMAGWFEQEDDRRAQLRREVLAQAGDPAEWGVRRVGEVEPFLSFDAAFEFADRYVYGLPGVEVVLRSPRTGGAWLAVCGPGGSDIDR